MSRDPDLERDIAEEDELRGLLRGGDGDLSAPSFSAIEERARHAAAPFGLWPAVAALVAMALVVGVVGRRVPEAGSSGRSLPGPTPTTIALPGSPCQPVRIEPDRFDNYIPIPPVPNGKAPDLSTHAAFTGDHFLGLGKVMSISSDGSSLVLELVDPTLFTSYGPTRVAITSQTSFDHTDLLWALVAASGVAKGATDLPLAPSAPPVSAGQQLFLECTISNAVSSGASAVAASAAPAGASLWRLSFPLPVALPAGSQVMYERKVHVARFADLDLAVGQTVSVALSGKPGDYRATALTNVVGRNVMSPGATPRIAPVRPTATPAAPAYGIGRRLGPVSIGMTAPEVTKLFGVPAQTTVTHGIGSPEWHYADGLVVYLGGPLPGTVWRLHATAPFTGTTAEGVRVGSTRADVDRLLAPWLFEMQTFGTQLQITDPPRPQLGAASTTVGIDLDASGHVDWIDIATTP